MPTPPIPVSRIWASSACRICLSVFSRRDIGLFLHDDEGAGGVRHAVHPAVGHVGGEFADGVADMPAILPDFAAQVDRIGAARRRG
ncbi:hypothetical protein G6F62_015755 [Rhizopus arrhizus]|nr:hypothetical protein G6F62_015755 [Rhizopus arrhizus]